MSDPEFELFSEDEEMPTLDVPEEDELDEEDEETLRIKAYKADVDATLIQISENEGLADPTPHLELLVQIIEGEYEMNQDMLANFNTRSLPKALRALLNRQNLADEEVANKVNSFVQRVVHWIVQQAEEGDKLAVENSAEELMKVFDTESAFYLHYGQWKEGDDAADSPTDSVAPEWRDDKLKTQEWIDARHVGSGKWMHALVMEETDDRVMLTYENLGDEHNEWFDKSSSDLAPLNSKCGGLVAEEEWRERLQAGDWIDVSNKMHKWCKGLILEVEHDVGKVKVHLEGYNDQILRMPIGNWKLAKFMTHTGTTGLVAPPLREAPVEDRLDSQHNYAELRTCPFGSSQHLVNNINYFGRIHGFDIAMNWLQGKEGDDGPTMLSIKFMVAAFAQIADFISREMAKQFVPQYVEAVVSAMLALKNDELRNIEKKDLDEIINSIAKILRRVAVTEAEVASVIEKPWRTLFWIGNGAALFLTFLSLWAGRYPNGLKTETKTYAGIELESRRPVPVAQSMDSDEFVQWIREKEVLSTIFRQPHRAMVERAVMLLRFLGRNHQLSVSDVDMMWECAINPSDEISQAALSAIRVISQYLDSSVLAHLFSKLSSVDSEDFTEPLVDLAAIIAHTSDVSSQATSHAALDLLMALTSDGSCVTPELAKTSREKLTSLLTKQNHPLLALSRDRFVEKCVNSLLQHNSVPVSLDLLREIVLTYPEKADKDARWQVITALEEKYSLLDALFNDVAAFTATAAEQIEKQQIAQEDIANAILSGSGHRSFVAAVQARLDFLTFLLINSILKLNTTHIDMLWDALVERSVCEAEAGIFFKWCRNACDSNNQSSIFDTEVTLYIFDEKIAKMKPDALNPVAFACLQQYFMYANTKQGKIEMTGKHAFNYEVVDPDLHGLHCIWKAALSSTHSDVLASANKLLCQLPSKLAESVDLRDFYSNHISRCMTVLLQKDSTTEQQERALGLLNSLISTAERGLLSQLPYRPHGAMSRGQSLMLYLQLANAGSKETDGKLQVPAHTNMTVLDLIRTASEAYSHPEAKTQLLWAGSVLFDGAKTLELLGATDGATLQVRLLKVEKKSDDKKNDEKAAKKLGRSDDQANEGRVLPSLVLCSEASYIATLFELLSANQAIAGDVWKLLMRLPTDKAMLEAMLSLQTVKKPEPEWDLLLDSHNVFKLLYQLQIIKSVLQPASEDDEDSERDAATERASWRKKFVLYGGFEHLYNLLMKTDIFDASAHSSSEMGASLHSMCLALVLRMIAIFLGSSVQAVSNTTSPAAGCSPPPSPGLSADDSAAPDYQLLVRQLSGGLATKVLDVVKCEELLPQLARLASEACSRAEESDDQVTEDTSIVQNVLDLMLITSGNPTDMLNQPYQFFNILLDCDCVGIRVVALQFFTHLCCGTREDAQVNAAMMLAELLRLMEEPDQLDELRDICQERFELLCRLLHVSSHTQDQWQVSHDQCMSIVAKLQTRSIREDSSNGRIDGVLVGLLRVVQALVMLQSELRHSVGPELVPLLLKDLFQTPGVDVSRCKEGPIHDTLDPPRCKTPAARDAAFRLLVALCDTEWDTLHVLLTALWDLVNSTQVAAHWNYNPSEVVCASAGRIGLKNLGNICYLNSMMQQLRMVPTFSGNMLTVELPNEDGKEASFLYQLQLMIGSLQLSHRKAYNPVNFCQAVMDWDGQPVDVRIQQDMSEFFGLLMNNLEAALKDTKHKDLVNQVLQGKFANQTFGTGGSNYKSERLEDFFLVNVAVKHTPSLEEALAKMIESEELKNFEVDGQEERITVRKRTVFEALPPTMLIMLNRFEWNFNVGERVKLNDYFEFPMDLDMGPYTKAGLAVAEDPDSAGQPIPAAPYRLKGVLIHSGTAEMGHYYSYICDRTDRETWWDYDDSSVTKINIANLPQLAFGGDYTHTVYDQYQKKYVTRKSTRTNNAYLLVYEQVALQERREPEARLPPVDIYQRVLLDNVSFLNDCHMFDTQYFGFMVELARQVKQLLFQQTPLEWPAEKTCEQQLQAIQMFTKFSFETLSHAKEMPTLNLMFLELKELFILCPIACQWLLKTLIEDTSMVAMLLFECPNSQVRAQVATLLLHVLNQEAAQEICEEPEPNGEERVDPELPLVPMSLGQRFILCLLHMMDDARKYWKNFTQYFIIFYQFCRLSADNTAWMNSQAAIFQLGDFLLGNDSIVQRVRRHSNVKMGGYEQPDFEPLLTTMNYLVSHVRGQYTESDWKMLCAQKLWEHCLNHGYGCRSGGPVPGMLAQLCQRNPAFSNFVMGILIDGIAVSNYNKIMPFLDAMGALLCIDDELQPDRLERMLAGEEGFLRYTYDFKDRYKRCTYVSIKWLTKMVASSTVLDRWMTEHQDDWVWMQVWLEEYLDEKEQNVQEAKTKKDLEAELRRANSAQQTLQVFQESTQRLYDDEEDIHEENPGGDFMASVGESIARSESTFSDELT